jgi:hypothetical protein
LIHSGSPSLNDKRKVVAVYRGKVTVTVSSHPCETPSPQPLRAFTKLVNSRWTFIGLQILDLTTTLVAFRLGAFELNPFVAHLTVMFGKVRGVVISKIMAIGIAMGVKHLLWVVNLFYLAIIFWNTIMLLFLPARLK